MSQEEYIIKLEEKNKNLQAKIDNLTEMILLLNKKQFGHSSEKTPKNQVLDNQLELDSFDEAEKLYNPKVIEPPLVDPLHLKNVILKPLENT